MRSVAFFFCMIGFKLKVQRFRRGELFEIVMMRGICHLVIDLDDVPQGCEPIFQEGRGKEREGRKGRERVETKKNKEVLRVPTLCIILNILCVRQC